MFQLWEDTARVLHLCCAPVTKAGVLCSYLLNECLNPMSPGILLQAGLPVTLRKKATEIGFHLQYALSSLAVVLLLAFVRPGTETKVAAILRCPQITLPQIC